MKSFCCHAMFTKCILIRKIILFIHDDSIIELIIA